MVTTVSPSVQAHYECEKRKKHTLEKSKVAHLTRQLQLRLQYAKLKVDHGWQRQNLNEVENLYFHHSLIRAPKLQLIQSPALVVNAVSAKSNIEPTSTQINVMHTGVVQAGSASLAPMQQPINVIADLPPTQQHHESVAQASSSAPTTTEDACNPPSSPSNQHQSESFAKLLQALANSCKKSTPTQTTTKPPLQPPTSPSVSFTSSDTPKTPNKSTTSHLFPSSTSTSALTYDSFWSNHTSSRPFRSPFLSLLSSTDPEVNKVATQALLSGLSGKNPTSYLNNPSRTPTDTTSTTLTPVTQRNLPTITEASESR